MNDKEKILDTIFRYLKESDVIIKNVADFAKYESSLPDMIKNNWNSQNEFFNEIAEFGLKASAINKGTTDDSE